MKVLVLQHVEHEHPGYIAEYAADNEIQLHIIKLWKGEKVPDSSGFDAMIIMGGPMGAYENYPSRDAEVELIKKSIGQIPMIGFCLGSQLIAYALAAKVYPKIVEGRKIKEVGYFDISLTNAGSQSEILKGFPASFEALEWHGDVFEQPEGAILLARSEICENQAFEVKGAYGFLFHFEFTPEMVNNQIKIDKRWIHEDNDLDEHELQKQAEGKAKQMKKQCYQLLDNFFAIMLK